MEALGEHTFGEYVRLEPPNGTPVEPSCNTTNVWNPDKNHSLELARTVYKTPPVSTVGSNKTGRHTFVDAPNDGGNTVRGRRIYIGMDDYFTSAHNKQSLVVENYINAQGRRRSYGPWMSNSHWQIERLP